MNKHFPVSTTMQQFIISCHPTSTCGRRSRWPTWSRWRPGSARCRASTWSAASPGPTARCWSRPSRPIRPARSAASCRRVTLIATNDQNLTLLTGGAHQLADVLDQSPRQVLNSMGSIRGLVSALEDMEQQFGDDVTFDQLDSTATLVANMQSLGSELATNIDTDHQRLLVASSIVIALNASPMCNIDPACVASRDELQRGVDGYDDGSLASYLTSAPVEGDPGHQTLDDISARSAASRQGHRPRRSKLGIDDEDSIWTASSTACSRAPTSSPTPASSSPTGVQLLVDQTRNIGGGLDQASGSCWR